MLQGDNTGAGMPNHLMLLAWPTGNEKEIAASLRYAPYVSPRTILGRRC